MAGTITGETTRGGQRKAKRQTTCKKQKEKGRELVPLVVGSYLTHGPLMSPATYLGS